MFSGSACPQRFDSGMRVLDHSPLLIETPERMTAPRGFSSHAVRALIRLQAKTTAGVAPLLSSFKLRPVACSLLPRLPYTSSPIVWRVAMLQIHHHRTESAG